MELRSLEHLTSLQPHIRLIASDVDGTLTLHEKFTSTLFDALAKLQQANIPLLLVTGRSAGWVDALRYYLPVAGAIAENGGLYFPNQAPMQILSPIQDIATHRHALAKVFNVLKQQYPHLQESADNAFRITDWTFDVEGLRQDELTAIAQACTAWGWSFTFSTVQCHIKPLQQNKAWGIQKVLYRNYPEILPEQVLTVGDSPNDEAMFDAAVFPISVGVANILHYRDRLTHLPKYITQYPGVSGFIELLDHLNLSDGSSV